MRLTRIRLRPMAMMVLIAAMNVAIPLVATSPAAACHEAWQTPFYLAYPRHHVFAVPGDPGGAAVCGAFVESAVLNRASAAPGTAMISDAEGFADGVVYRIRFEGGTARKVPPILVEFPGGTGPFFTANWTVPTTARPGTNYQVSVIDPTGAIVSGTEVAFTVL